MANVLIEEQTLKDIADSIRAKSGKTNKMLPSAMSGEITNLPSGGSIQNGIEYLEFNSNGYLTNAKVYGNEVINYAFYNCSRLALTELPSSITSIGLYAFYNCSFLSLTELPAGITSIGDYAFSGCYTLSLTELPSGITSIRSYAFQSCSELALTELPSGITSIGDYAFYNCSRLALTELPSGITSIGDNAFYYCSKLALTELPAGITSIGDYAFQSCKGLTTLTFKGTPTTIASSAFSKCTKLLTINVPWAEGEVNGAPWGATNATINYNYGQPKPETYTIRFLSDDGTVLQSSELPYGEIPAYNGSEPTKTEHKFAGWTPTISVVTGAMDYVATFKSTKSQARPLVDRSITTISSDIISVGRYAFAACDDLTTVDLPNATSIGYYAFSRCSDLKTINIPNVTSIEDGTFFECSKLQTVDLPNATSIKSDAFYGSGLTTVILRSSALCELKSTWTFYETPIKSGTGYIYVPRALVDTYKTATNWSTFANQFRAIEDYPNVCGGV